MEVLAVTYGTTPEGKALIAEKVLPVLEELKADSDADVRYYAAHALTRAGPHVCGTNERAGRHRLPPGAWPVLPGRAAPKGRPSDRALTA